MEKFSLIVLSVLLIGTSCETKSNKVVAIENSTEQLTVKIENRIFDRIDLLKPVEKEQIFITIQELEKSIGSQIAIVIIDTLDGEMLDAFSLKTFEELKLGRKKFKDGVLITIVYKEHKIRIEVGYGLEKIIKDEIASRIIKDEMVPKFREDKYFEGIITAVTKIKKLIEDNKQLVGQMPL